MPEPALAPAVGNQLLTLKTIPTMATNKPMGDDARKSAVRKRGQLRSKVMGETTWTKRDRTTGKFMDQKKAPAKKKFKGVRREKTG
jgi:hypothetical protein